MKKLILLFYAILLSITGLLAQTEYKPGYIISESGDTLRGSIALRRDAFLSKKCLYKSSDGVVKTFTPSEIKGYGFDEGRCFAVKEINDKLHFFEVLVKGQLSLYRMHNKNDLFFLEKQDSTHIKQIPITEKKEVIRDSQSYIFVSKQHWGFLMGYMQDAPTIENDIKEIRFLNTKELTQLTKKYHEIVCPEEGCVVFEGKSPAVRIFMELHGGTVMYNQKLFTEKNTFLIGALAHISFPRITSQFYFRTGLLYRKVKNEYYNGWSDFYKPTAITIPMVFEYMPPSGTIRPRLGYGLTYNFVKGLVGTAPTASAGIGFQLTNKLFGVINYDVELTPRRIFFIPRKYASGCISAGIMINLTAKR